MVAKLAMKEREMYSLDRSGSLPFLLSPLPYASPLPLKARSHLETERTSEVCAESSTHSLISLLNSVGHVCAQRVGCFLPAPSSLSLCVSTFSSLMSFIIISPKDFL